MRARDGDEPPVAIASFHEREMAGHMQIIYRPKRESRDAVTARRVGLVALVALLTAGPATAQTLDCTPTPIQTLAWGTAGQAIVPVAEDKTTNVVPVGDLWIIKAAGIGQGVDPGVALEYRLQIDHQWPDLSWWYTAVEIVTPQRGTPVLALTRPLLLEAGERLSARSNTMPNGGTMYVMALGWRVPAACLPRLLGLVAPVSGTTTAPPPDYTGLIAAVTALQDAAAALQAAIPREQD